MLEFRGTVGWRTGSVRPRWRLLVVSLVWMRLGDGRSADMSSRDQSVRGSVRRVNRPLRVCVTEGVQEPVIL
uniref:Putative secreted protein n=1 Tax=Ixodes ricinus TaxID=34613 RepID=A0A6B0U215_IXORI